MLRERPDLPQLTGVIMLDGRRQLFTTDGLPGARALTVLRFSVCVPTDFAQSTLNAWIRVASTFTLNYHMSTLYTREDTWVD
jgi:hypothetical protein